MAIFSVGGALVVGSVVGAGASIYAGKKSAGAIKSGADASAAATIEATQHHTEGTVSNMDDYLRIKPSLYPDHSAALESMRPWAQRQAAGEAVVWATIEGFFWFPRTLMDIEKLSYAYYDEP